MIGIREYALDLRGLTRNEGEVALRMAAARLQLDAGLLFTELALSSYAYIQTRNVMGYPAILTLSIRGAFDDAGTMQAGSNLTGRLCILTPDNTPGSVASTVVVYNNYFLSVDYAMKSLWRLRTQARLEVGLVEETA